jgi:hypothetical protein
VKLQEAIRFFVYPPTSGPKATIALRLMAGAVFFWEGLLKFAYANQGVGRFTKGHADARGARTGDREVRAMRKIIEIAATMWLIAGCASGPNSTADSAVSLGQECMRDGGWWRAQLAVCEVQAPGAHAGSSGRR